MNKIIYTLMAVVTLTAFFVTNHVTGGNHKIPLYNAVAISGFIYLCGIIVTVVTTKKMVMLVTTAATTTLAAFSCFIAKAFIVSLTGHLNQQFVNCAGVIIALCFGIFVLQFQLTITRNDQIQVFQNKSKWFSFGLLFLIVSVPMLISILK